MSGTWQNTNGAKGLGKGRDQGKILWQTYRTKIKHWKLSKPGKNRKKSGGAFVEGGGDIGEKHRFLLLAGRFLFYEAVTQISSTKGESFT